jgi:hypothetical protein
MLAGCGGKPDADADTPPAAGGTQDSQDQGASGKDSGSEGPSATSATSATSASGELVEYDYFTLNLEGGWIFYRRSGGIELRYESPDSNKEMFINVNTNRPPDEILAGTLDKDGAIQGGNMTFGGVEYFVVELPERDRIFLISTKTLKIYDPGWDEDAEPAFEITLDYATIEQAKPVLETLIMRNEITELVQEWPATEEVETEWFSFTAKDGWYLYKKFNEPYSISKLNDLCHDDYGYIWISYSVSTAGYIVTDHIPFANSVEQQDNVTIGGIEYMVLEGSFSTWLVTTRGPELTPDEGGSITIELRGVAIDKARPVLETFVINN